MGPQNGRWATNALPGYSWHQWGEAVDAFWLVNGKSEWAPDKLIDGKNGYKVYAAEAKKMGLTSLGSTLDDWPHVQLRQIEVSRAYSLTKINALMKEKFGKI